MQKRRKEITDEGVGFPDNFFAIMGFKRVKQCPHCKKKLVIIKKMWNLICKDCRKVVY